MAQDPISAEDGQARKGCRARSLAMDPVPASPSNSGSPTKKRVSPLAASSVDNRNSRKFAGGDRRHYFRELNSRVFVVFFSASWMRSRGSWSLERI